MTIFEPSSIEGHVYLETRSSCSVKVDGAVGSVGFLANRSNYLHTEYLYTGNFSFSCDLDANYISGSIS